MMDPSPASLLELIDRCYDFCVYDLLCHPNRIVYVNFFLNETVIQYCILDTCIQYCYTDTEYVNKMNIIFCHCTCGTIILLNFM